MKKMVVLLSAALLLASCGGDDSATKSVDEQVLQTRDKGVKATGDLQKAVDNEAEKIEKEAQ
ncbi:hypothetical protein [Kingella negevensis]|uniref:hypothetical protein n=1 Tax=Kingella negevensis TaxID=1522312 RepID=UPI000A26CD89|nr:hypothetical protein [Kingella negevensis]WII91649.1 hypothetical protein QEO93_03450 [Kingella negevensis]